MSSKKFGSEFLKGLVQFRVAEGIVPSVCEEFLSSLDCPRALTVLLLFRNGEHEQLAQLETNPLNYRNMVEFRDAYAATKFLSKFKGLTLSYDLDDVALTKFREFEALCGQTNLRFKHLQRDPLYAGRVVWLHSAVIRKIERVLGEFSSEEFFSQPDWGPGASTLIKRREASPARKFQLETGITRDLYDLIPLSILRAVYPLWGKHLDEVGFPTFQVGNKVITVPKDATTNRVIAVEPGINLWFQKAVGNMVGRRLRRCGIDLRYQSKNQRLAYKGSLSNLIASVDLSSASDSISRAVVEELLPPRWFSIMDSCRSHYGSQSGQAVLWNKFSSMGNGFTFQLESLIFFAVAFCCTEYLHQDLSLVSAYGDDVLLPSVCFELFQEMMSFYGFRVNGKKSHHDSPFRESCGAHYYLGVDVKPIYLKDRVESVLPIYRLANALRRLAHRRNSNFGCDARLRRSFELLVQKVPSALRLRIPYGYGDGGFIANLDEATPSRARFGVEGYHYYSVTEPGKTWYDETEGYLLASLWKLPEVTVERQRTLAMLQLLLAKGNLGQKSHAKLQAIASLPFGHSQLSQSNKIMMTGRTKVRVAKSLAQQWYDLGPWV
jgi:hypothetical protein